MSASGESGLGRIGKNPGAFWRPRLRPCANCKGGFLSTAPCAIRCPACAAARAAMVAARATAKFNARRKAARK